MATLFAPAAQPAEKRPTPFPVIDTDIHIAFPSPERLRSFLPLEWQTHHHTFGPRGHQGSHYPRSMPNAARHDSWPATGGPPGSDLDFLRQQLLDEWDLEIGILTPLQGAGEQRNLAFGAAMAQAVNDWQLADWIEQDARLRGSILVAYEDGPLAAAEIDRLGEHPDFVQVLIIARTSEPLGRRKYWPMYEAAQRHNLPVAMHFGGAGGGPITGAGWPSYYIEDHAGMSQAFQAQVTSLVCDGVFEQFPNLQFVLIEGGFAWLPPLMWRLDAAWAKLKAETPWLTRKPSEVIREHFWITTQPMEEPSQPRFFRQLLAQLDMNDRLMFATDYPHWDFDAPDRAIPVPLDKGLTEQIMAGNARRLYGF